MFGRLLFIVSLLGVYAACAPQPKPDIDSSQMDQCVILLHGLARTADSMEVIENALLNEGYYVVNAAYPSRKHKIQELAASAIPEGIAICEDHVAGNIHFVTHSLGGILVRQYLAANTIDNLGRVVMLSPPNQGSEVVDTLKGVPGFFLLNGPAGMQLGTDASSLPVDLPPVTYEVGVITGDKTINYILSMIIPGVDDGKVSVERAKVAGMSDFLVVAHSHPFIMKSEEVIAQILAFLSDGQFDH